MVDAATTVDALRERVRQFVHERDWEQFQNPKDLAIAMSIEASELLENFLWRMPGPPSEWAAEARRSVASELADVLIYGISLANALDLDVSEAILTKLRADESKYPKDEFRGRAR